MNYIRHSFVYGVTEDKIFGLVYVLEVGAISVDSWYLNVNHNPLLTQPKSKRKQSKQ